MWRNTLACSLIFWVGLGAGCGPEGPSAPSAPSPVVQPGGIVPAAEPASSPLSDGPRSSSLPPAGAPSASAALESSLTGPIRNFRVFLDEYGRIALSWNPPLEPSDVSDYAVFRDAYQILEYHLDAGLACSGEACLYVVGHRANGSHRFGVAAINSQGGDGPASWETFVVAVELPPAVPEFDVVQLVDAEPSNNAEVRWNPIQSDGAADITIIHYEISREGASRTIDLAACTGSGAWACRTVYEALTLDPHLFSVRARNSAGFGPNRSMTVSIVDPASDTSTSPLPALQAEWTNVPVESPYPQPFTLRLDFTEAPAMSYRTLQTDGAIVVSGGVLRRARRVSRGDNTSWHVDIRPSNATADLRVEVRGGRPCHEPAAICSADGRQLSHSPAVVIPAPSSDLAPDLRAEWRDVPASYTTSTVFTAKLVFSEDFPLSYRTLQAAITVTGGAVDRVRRVVRGANKEWSVAVRPGASSGSITLELAGNVPCDQPDGICTSDGRRLADRATAVVPPVS